MERIINKVVPIFYACDDNFVKYTIVSLRSMIDNASKDRDYKVYVLNTGISSQMKSLTKELETENFCIEFVDVQEQLKRIGKKLPLRDYYSKTTYFRMFIAEMFPFYDKAIYIDSDTIVNGDISKLFDEDIKNNLVGACKEQVMIQTDVFGEYVEKVMGIDRNNYFNAGLLVINCKEFRRQKVFDKFLNLLSFYNFVVTQDEDYLNVICQDKVYWLDQGWNTEVYGEIPVCEDEIKVIHYIMVSKPWHYKDCRLKEYFWNYAEKTKVFDSILNDFYSYTEEKKINDSLSCIRLAETAKRESEKEDNYFRLINGGRFYVKAARS